MTILRGVAKITGAGAVKPLDGKAPPDQQVTEKDVQEPPKLARLLTDVLRDLAALKRRHYPRRIDFEDQAAPGPIRLRHGFNGRVRWWVVDWTSAGTNLVDSGGDTLSASWCDLTKQSDSDANMLVLQGHVTGTATIRVEEAG